MNSIPQAGVAPATPVTSKRKPWWRQLYLQVLIAVVLGILLGHYAPWGWA